jgi:hypothetical protein
MAESIYTNPSTPMSLPLDGTFRVAYLPNNSTGRRALALPKRTWLVNSTFGVVRAAKLRLTYCPRGRIWHKTSIAGGAQSFGYPDPKYLNRVISQPAELGITDATVNDHESAHQKHNADDDDDGHNDGEEQSNKPSVVQQTSTNETLRRNAVGKGANDSTTTKRVTHNTKQAPVMLRG